MIGDLHHDLALVLADLDCLERWLHRAGRELAGSLGAMQARAGVAPGFDYLAAGSLSRWDPEDPACRALLWRALEAAAEDLPAPECLADPDWTRARSLERRLRAVPGEPARTLAWLVGHATPESTLAELAARVGWELATLPEREAWVAAGVVATQERVLRRAGRPRRVVQRAMVSGPREAGMERLRDAVMAWVESA